MTIWLNERARFYFTEVADARELRTAAVELRDALRTTESSQRGYLVTGNEIYLAPYDVAKSLALRQLEILNRKLENSARSIPMLGRLRTVVSEKIAEMDATILQKRERHDAEALAIFRTNRGKALMDEANVFLFGVILAADERLTNGVEEQRSNAGMLRLASVLGGIVIILVVGAMVLTVARYTREIVKTRDEVRALNASLEDRVARRTADLESARERAEVLLAEVNHRVANSLTLVASLVKLQSNSAEDQATKDALAETQARIFAISSIHQRLYTSGDARSVALDEYLSGLLSNLEISMRAEGHTASLTPTIESLSLITSQAVNLGIIVTEWVTNAFKYAYHEYGGEIRVLLRSLPGNRVELAVEDDGVGRSKDAEPKGTGLGTRIVAAMAKAMGGDVLYEDRSPGTTARFVFAPRLAERA